MCLFRFIDVLRTRCYYTVRRLMLRKLIVKKLFRKLFLQIKIYCKLYRKDIRKISKKLIAVVILWWNLENWMQGGVSNFVPDVKDVIFRHEDEHKEIS